MKSELVYKLRMRNLASKHRHPKTDNMEQEYHMAYQGWSAALRASREEKESDGIRRKSTLFATQGAQPPRWPAVTPAPWHSHPGRVPSHIVPIQSVWPRAYGISDDMSFMRLGCERLQILSWALSPLPVCPLSLGSLAPVWAMLGVVLWRDPHGEKLMPSARSHVSRLGNGRLSLSQFFRDYSPNLEPHVIPWAEAT